MADNERGHYNLDLVQNHKVVVTELQNWIELIELNVHALQAKRFIKGRSDGFRHQTTENISDSSNSGQSEAALVRTESFPVVREAATLLIKSHSTAN